VVMAQRLVRVLCSHCKETYLPSDAERDMLKLPADTSIWRPAPSGCKHCNHQGYRGRKGIYELIEISERLRHLIHEQAGEQELLAEARKHSPSMSDDGRQCVLNGITSIEEVLRVTTQL
jgi:general secretion pathway protein E